MAASRAAISSSPRISGGSGQMVPNRRRRRHRPNLHRGGGLVGRSVGCEVEGSRERDVVVLVGREVKRSRGRDVARSRDRTVARTLCRGVARS